MMWEGPAHYSDEAPEQVASYRKSHLFICLTDSELTLTRIYQDVYLTAYIKKHLLICSNLVILSVCLAKVAMAVCHQL